MVEVVREWVMRAEEKRVSAPEVVRWKGRGGRRKKQERGKMRWVLIARDRRGLVNFKLVSHPGREREQKELCVQSD